MLFKKALSQRIEELCGNAIFPTAFELAAPLRRLFIQRRNIEATPEVYIGVRMNQIRLCNF